MVLFAWARVLLLLLYLVVVPHHLTQVVLGTPDVPQSLSSLSKACLMPLLVVLSIHLLPICVALFFCRLYLGLSPRYESLDVWPVVRLLWYAKRCSRLNMYSLPVWAFSVPVVSSRMYF